MWKSISCDHINQCHGKILKWTYVIMMMLDFSKKKIVRFYSGFYTFPLTISLFPEFRGHLDDQLPVSCIRVHSTHGCCVGTREIVEVPPTKKHTQYLLFSLVTGLCCCCVIVLRAVSLPHCSKINTLDY